MCLNFSKKSAELRGSARACLLSRQGTTHNLYCVVPRKVPRCSAIS